MSRKATRKAFAELLKGPLIGAGLAVPDADGKPGTVRNGRPANFYGALTVICVYSGGTDWNLVTKGSSLRDQTFVVDVFVKYADAELDWTEGQAEDALDDICDIVLDVVDDNQTGLGWQGLSVTERTRTGDTVDVNGTEYRRETITLATS